MNTKAKIVIENDGNEDEYCKTFVIFDEDHTLANSLRYLIMKNPDVVFCGYSLPHPSENKVNFRIQTKQNTTALQCLEKGLENLHQLCEHVLETFDNEVTNFNKNHS